MQRTPQRDTPCELALRGAVHGLGLRFRVDWPLSGTRRRADLAFTRARLAVFVDGCFWHRCPLHGTLPKSNGSWWRTKLSANVDRDRDTDARLVAAGWHVLRFWEHEDMTLAAARVKGAVDRLSRDRRA
jgi:DNA mismatch endonuclease (patch repair protein)